MERGVDLESVEDCLVLLLSQLVVLLHVAHDVIKAYQMAMLSPNMTQRVPRKLPEQVFLFHEQQLRGRQSPDAGLPVGEAAEYLLVAEVLAGVNVANVILNRLSFALDLPVRLVHRQLERALYLHECFEL